MSSHAAGAAVSAEARSADGVGTGVRRDAVATEPSNLVRAIWPLLLAVFVCNTPNPASNIFVSSMSADFGVEPTFIGALRGVSGIAALTVGFLAAPLLDRAPRGWTVCIGMALAAAGSLLTLVGLIPALVVSFFALGCSLALVMPAIQAAGGDLFRGPAAGKAASAVTAVQSLSGVLSGPVLALPALLAGWHGAYLTMAVAAVVTTVFVAPRLSWSRPEGVRRMGYLEAFAAVARAPGAVPLLLTATVRNCVTQAWLAFLAAMLADRFQAGIAMTAAFWFVGAGCVFLGNVWTARLIRVSDGGGLRWWRSADQLLLLSTIATILTSPLVYLAPTLETVVVGMILFCLMAGVTISCLVSVLMHHFLALRGPVMGLNATGQNIGMVIGTGLATVGLSLGGYVGLGVTLGLISCVALAFLFVARRALGSMTVASAVSPV